MDIQIVVDIIKCLKSYLMSGGQDKKKCLDGGYGKTI